MNNIINSIISSYSTPSYVFDIKELTGWINDIRSILSDDINLCYAMKANPFLTKAMSELTDRLEVCSPGEYEICIRNNINPKKIVVSGVNKTEESMKRIMTYSKGAGIYTIESPLQYEILKSVSISHNIRLQVLLRLSNGNQFGMDEALLMELINRIQSDNIMDIKGIHFYGGTQKNSRKMKHELEILKGLGARINKEYNLNNMELEYGPGLYVNYFTDNDDGEKTEQLKELSDLLTEMSAYSHITIELGRFLTAYCGYYITRVMDKKKTKDINYLIVDGGIHQISYYGQMLGMKKPYIEHFISISDEAEYISYIKKQDYSDIFQQNRATNNNYNTDSTEYTICGSLCTANDVLVKQYELSDVNIGDILIFERCGAYSVTEAMALFLSRELPQILLITPDNKLQVIRESMETYLLNSYYNRHLCKRLIK